ncbi:MAG: Holliday junction resolvase RuvX [Gammaproteobacteria bacterium]|nr:MAG: Holliday junction resolvase RuvX [Gammaproteobacteria bacterium]
MHEPLPARNKDHRLSTQDTHPSTPTVTAPTIVLGFDYGARRIGIAIANTLTGTARPLNTISNNQETVQAIKALIQNWQPGLLLVGLPLSSNGAETESSRAAAGFAERLENAFGLPVQMHNEFLSTHAAAEVMAKQAKADKDAAAAAIILQGWMENTHD